MNRCILTIKCLSTEWVLVASLSAGEKSFVIDKMLVRLLRRLGDVPCQIAPQHSYNCMEVDIESPSQLASLTFGLPASVTIAERRIGQFSDDFDVKHQC